MNSACRRLSPTLSLLAAGCLPATERAGVQTHLVTCSACAARLEEARSLCAVLAADAAMTVPMEVPARLRALRPTGLLSPWLNQRLAGRWPPAWHSQRGRPLLAGSLAMLGATLLAASLLVFGRGRSPVASTAPPTAAKYRVYVPARQRSTLLSVSEGKVVQIGPEQRPVRRVRAVWLDETTYVGQDRSVLHRRITRTETISVALEAL